MQRVTLLHVWGCPSGELSVSRETTPMATAGSAEAGSRLWQCRGCLNAGLLEFLTAVKAETQTVQSGSQAVHINAASETSIK